MYQFYVEEYHGNNIDQTTFDRLCVEAEAYVNALITNPENLKYEQIDRKRRLAVCAAVDCLYAEKETAEQSIKASESVGDHSVSYRDTRKTSDEYSSELRRKVMLYLSGTGLCYSALR